MSSIVSMWLGVLFLFLAIAAVLLQAWLWGPKFWNEKEGKTEAPRLWLTVHALAGYGYTAVYIVMMWNMVPRLWEYQDELPARTVFHAVLGVTIGVLLICKIGIILFFRHFEESMPSYGFGLLLCTVLLSALSIPYAMHGADIAGGAVAQENIERVRRGLAKVDFGDQVVDLEALTTRKGLEVGRSVLAEKCTVCHDMRTILARPRSPQRWYDVSQRMLDKPSVFGEHLEPDDIPSVTAYLAAITPELRELSKARPPRPKTAAAEPAALSSRMHNAETPRHISTTAGESLLRTHCTSCHGLDENAAHGPDDPSGWSNVVASMVEEGADVDRETATDIAAYLAQKFPQDATPPPTLKPVPPSTTTSRGDAAMSPVVAGSREEKPQNTRQPHKDTRRQTTRKGRSVYMAKCKSCHGGNGKGKTKIGEKLGIKSLSRASRGRIRSAILNGVPGTKMRAYRTKLSRAEVDAVAQFVKRL